MILGGSTNAVLHLIAIAHSVGINLTLEDFQAVSDRTPFIADLKPSGKYVMVSTKKIQTMKKIHMILKKSFQEDVYKIGGIPSTFFLFLRLGNLRRKLY